jgi:hypothetical protein
MQQVDLKLAINYIPACGCLIRLIALIVALAITPVGKEILGGYLVIAAALYLDRTLTRKIIFDGNSILVAVFCANVHAVIRSTPSNLHVHPAIIVIVHIIWSCVCTALIADPPQVRQILERQAISKRIQAKKLIPVCSMLVVQVTTAYFYSEIEPLAIRALRAVHFTLLSFTWIYLVGLNSNQGVSHLKETSWQFVARLAPILYATPWVAALFSLSMAWIFIAHHTTHIPEQSPYQYAPFVQPEPLIETPQPVATTEDTEAQLEQELFRQAKQALQNSGKAGAF